MPTRSHPVFLGLLAAVPLSLYLWLMWRMDRYEREPVRLLLLVFGWGAVGAVVMTALVHLGIVHGGVGAEGGFAVRSVLLAPVIEEPAKALIFLWLFRHREFDNVTDGFVYGAAAGLGFAMTENFSYFLAAAKGGTVWEIFVVRTLYSALLHAGATSIVGASFGLAKFRRRAEARVLPWIGLSAAIVMHMVWNGLLVLDQTAQSQGRFTVLDLLLFPVEFLILFLLFGRCIRHEENLLACELAGEVPEKQLPLLTDYRKHGRVCVPPGVSRKQYVEACVRLAFRKRQATLVSDPTYDAEVLYWRRRVKTLLTGPADPGPADTS